MSVERVCAKILKKSIGLKVWRSHRFKKNIRGNLTITPYVFFKP